MKRTVQGIVLLLACSSANASLQSRMSGQAVYDSTQNLSWVADANLASTSGFMPSGLMTDSQARAWIASLNTARYLGVSDWRLPVTAQPDATCDTEFVPGEFGGFNCTGSEMGHLYYVDGVSLASPGPFSNINGGSRRYLSSTRYAPSISNFWWNFSFVIGYQYNFDEGAIYFAWAVRTGDIDADGDGFAEGSDNCTLVANPTQLDADGDGYGNICDADLNNTGLTTSTDFSLLRSVLNRAAGASPLAAAADMNGSGLVTASDFGLLRARLNTAPGPSYLNLKYLLTGATTGNGSGTVSSNPAGINCGATCSATYTYNTVVTLTAVAQAGSTFAGWSGDCTGTGSCVVTMNTPRSVSADFTPNMLLTVTRGGNGSGTVTSSPAGINCGADCSESYAQHSVVTLSATPLAGSAFSGWSGSCTGTGTCMVTMNGARSVTATFTSLLDTNPACSSNTYLGPISGDTGAGVRGTSGLGEAWFRVFLSEDDSTFFTQVYLSATITLTSPPGVDYDLYVYCQSCGGTLAGSSTLGVGQTDTVNVRRNDVIGTDDGFNVLIEVRYFTGGSNNSWGLSVTGNTAVSTATCP